MQSKNPTPNLALFNSQCKLSFICSQANYDFTNIRLFNISTYDYVIRTQSTIQPVMIQSNTHSQFLQTRILTHLY